MLYKGSTKIGSFQLGSTKIGKLYKGSTLVYKSGYPSGTILFENGTPGTYTINIKYDTLIYIDLCGSGGAGATGYLTHHTKYGGSAGYIYGETLIPAGSYEIIVAAPSANESSFNGNIAGGGGNATTRGAGSDGSGGSVTVVSSGLIGSNGSSGSTTSRILSYGGGGSGNGSSGQSGYCKIVTV